MKAIHVYNIGRLIPLKLNIKSIDKRLNFVKFPYNSGEIITTSLTVFFGFILLSIITKPFSSFLSYVFMFLGLVLPTVLYIYPSSVYYNHVLGDYNEEMLRALLRLSTFISLGNSFEYSFRETTKHLHGILKEQFQDIYRMLSTKQETTIGNAMKKYIPIWNKFNPVFVKSLRLLQTAEMSPKQERDNIIKETLETLLIEYHTASKRFAESLAGRAKNLVVIGVLIPIMTLMLLPLLSVFLPELVKPSILLFVYIVFFPAITLVMAMSFAANRIQVDTIRIEHSYKYKKLPLTAYIIPLGIAFVFSIPTIIQLNAMHSYLSIKDITFMPLINTWFLSLGLALAIYVFAYLYIKRYEKLWNEVYGIESDLPHLLQSFSTYLTLNISVENVIPQVIQDYEAFGMKSHPVVRFFKVLLQELATTKQNLMQLIKQKLPRICPSQKVSALLEQIISFTNISQKSAARAAKLVREQIISMYKLDDYIKTMLADTVGLINVTIVMLAPLLCAAAVIMSVAIVKSLNFIKEQLESIFTALGGTNLSFQLVQVDKIISPFVIEAIVGVYLVETILTLSIFSTFIKIGNDRYQLLKNIKSNMVGFAIYSGILIIGYYFMLQVIFKAVLKAG